MDLTNVVTFAVYCEKQDPQDELSGDELIDAIQSLIRRLRESDPIQQVG